MAGELRTELTVNDLASITDAVRKLKPQLNNHNCIGVEVPREGDANVIFHMRPEKDEDDGAREDSIVIISAQLILELFGGTGNVEERA